MFVKVNVFKDPVTDVGKKSKKGRLKLIKDTYGNFHTQEEIPVSMYSPSDPTVSCMCCIASATLLRLFAFNRIVFSVNLQR